MVRGGINLISNNLAVDNTNKIAIQHPTLVSIDRNSNEKNHAVYLHIDTDLDLPLTDEQWPCHLQNLLIRVAQSLLLQEDITMKTTMPVFQAVAAKKAIAANHPILPLPPHRTVHVEVEDSDHDLPLR